VGGGDGRRGFAGAESGKKASEHGILQVGNTAHYRIHFHVEIDIPRWSDRDATWVNTVAAQDNRNTWRQHNNINIL
jgi:hypothetical protein